MAAPTIETLSDDPNLQRLWTRARARLESNGKQLSGAITLKDPTEDERQALEFLLGVRRRGQHLQIRLEDLDRCLRVSAISIDLIGFLELRTPLRERRKETSQLQEAVEATIDAARCSGLASEPWFSTWLEDAERDGLITKLVKGSEESILSAAVRVLEALPGNGIPLPILAGRITNDTKALDRGTLATLVLRALAVLHRVSRPTRAEDRRMLWEASGVVADDLASQVLVLNLPTSGNTPLGSWLSGAARDGVPFRVTMNQLTTYPLEVQPTVLRLCENPAVLRAASHRFGAHAPPMICSEGQPSLAFTRLLTAFVEAGSELWAHGDFDWPGVRMVRALMTRHGARPWRMDRIDYRAAAASSTDQDELLPLAGESVATIWDPGLRDEMQGTGKIVFEEMVIESLLADLEAGQHNQLGLRVSVNQLITLTRCAHKVSLDASANVTEKDPSSAFLEMLWTERTSLLDAVAANVGAVEAEAGLAGSSVLMARGVPWIRRAELAASGLVGVADLLQREDIPSKLGGFGYLPVLVRAVIVDAALRLHHRIELCALADLLGRIQGRRPTVGKIIDRDGVHHTVSLTPFWASYEEYRPRVVRVLGGETTQPGRKAECQLCAWEGRCHRDLIDRDDLTLVPGIGESYRSNLHAIGIKTRSELAAAAPERLESAPQVGDERARAWGRHARVQLSGHPQRLATWTPPPVDFEIAYDIEDFSFRSFVYLHGLETRSHGTYGGRVPNDAPKAFEPVIAEPGEDEASLWQRFLSKLDTLESRGSYCVYVYSHHEQGSLRRLARKYGGSSALDTFASRLVDVRDVIQRTVVLPTESTGLKQVARYVGFAWRDSVANGAESLSWWDMYTRDPSRRDLLQRTLNYNEDDLLATYAVVDWLADFAGA